MAQLFPKFSNDYLENISSAAEVKFYHCCANRLPDRLLIIHSMALLQDNKNSSAFFGECDFVIFDPYFGLFIIEVKGGGIEFNPNLSKNWFSVNKNGEKFQIKDPFRQSENNMFRVSSVVQAKIPFINKEDLLIGNAVAFPDVADITPMIAHDRPIEIIASSKNLDCLEVWYEKLCQFWCNNKKYKPLGKLGLKEVEKYFLKSILVKPSLETQLKDEEQKRISLTQDQMRLVIFLENQKKANVSGGAGTGKTVLAKHMAESFAKQGMKTLLLCFNRALGDELHLSLSHIKNLDVDSFHKFFRDIILSDSSNNFHELEQQAAEAYPQEDKWNVQLPLAYSMALEAMNTRYEAIIVDEAQDLSAESWMPIEFLLKSDQDTKFFVFSDTNQSLYSGLRNVPKLSPPYMLINNCRNTRQIHEYAYTNYEGPVVSPPEISGKKVMEMNEDSIEGQGEKIISLIKEFVFHEKIPPENIVVLIADSQTIHDKYELLVAKGRNLNFVNKDRIIPREIRVTTVKRFKGLESVIVILWGARETWSDISKELKYVGVSRAKSLCYVVN